MKINTKVLQDACGKILFAVDKSSSSFVAETVELVGVDNKLKINITNGELNQDNLNRSGSIYYVSILLDTVEVSPNFYAIVDADLFLNLVNKLTTDTVELVVNESGNALKVLANGNYKVPIKTTTLTPIDIENVTNEFIVNGDDLLNISVFNAKDLANADESKLKGAQKYFYLDQDGCITYPCGACVNNFKVDQPFKLCLDKTTVKLFKLFKGGNVKFSIGFDNATIQTRDGEISGVFTKVKFETGYLTIVAISDINPNLATSVPVDKIRERANKEYPYSVVFRRDLLLNAVNRLLLFSVSKFSNKASHFTFYNDKVVIVDKVDENGAVENSDIETVYYSAPVTTLNEPYVTSLDLNDIKIGLESCTEETINLSFGDDLAVVIKRGNITNVVSQIKKHK